MSAAAVAAALIALAAAAPPAHARGAGRRPAKTKAAAHAGKKAAAPRAKIASSPEGKVVLLPLRDDDDRSFTSQVERLMRARGVEVVTDVRGVDTPEQFRELATHLGIAAFVEGTLKEREGDAISKVTVQVRSGYTGRKLTAITFRETKLHLRAQMEDMLSSKIGPAIARACARREQAAQARSRADDDRGGRSAQRARPAEDEAHAARGGLRSLEPDGRPVTRGEARGRAHSRWRGLPYARPLVIRHMFGKRPTRIRVATPHPERVHGFNSLRPSAVFANCRCVAQPQHPPIQVGCGRRAQHPRIQVGCGRGVEAGCSSTRNGPPARLQPTRPIHVAGGAVADGASVTAGARCHPEKCGPELHGSTYAGARRCLRKLSST